MFPTKMTCHRVHIVVVAIKKKKSHTFLAQIILIFFFFFLATQKVQKVNQPLLPSVARVRIIAHNSLQFLFFFFCGYFFYVFLLLMSKKKCDKKLTTDNARATLNKTKNENENLNLNGRLNHSILSFVALLSIC